MITHRALHAEIKRLKSHLHTKMDIDSEASEKMKTAVDELKKQNENLRISVQNLLTKPGRRELRQLQVYQRALDLLSEKTPGFSPAWQSAVRQAESEIEKTDSGLLPFIKKVIPTSGAIESSDEAEARSQAHNNAHRNEKGDSSL